MPVSEQKQRNNRKWDAANMATLACRVRKDKAERFAAAAARNGTNVNKLFQGFIDAYLEAQEADPDK